MPRHDWTAFSAIGNEPAIARAKLILATLAEHGPAAETAIAHRTGIRLHRTRELCRRMLTVGWVKIDDADRIALDDPPPSLR